MDKYTQPLLKRLKRLAYITLLFSSAFVSIYTSPVSAIDDAQKAVFDNGIGYYNLKDCQGGGDQGGGGNLKGGDNIEKAFNYLVSIGFTPVAAAALVGNFMVEAPGPGGIDPAISQGGGGPGRGIAQWSVGERWQGVIALAQQQGKAPEDLQVQLDYVKQELTEGGYKKVGDQLKTITDVQQASDLVLHDYEQAKDSAPGGQNSQVRGQNAKDVLAKFGNGAGGGATDGGGGGDCGKKEVSKCTEATDSPTADPNAPNVPNPTPPASADSTANSTADAPAEGNVAILCEARKFDPMGYLWGGGHEDPEQFMARFNAAGGYTQPPQHYLDCSGLEVVAIWNAFHVKAVFATSAMASMPQYLKSVPVAEAQPGDLMWHPGHTEIATVTGGAKTFGAHEVKPNIADDISDSQGQQWQAAYRYIGPGSSDAGGGAAAP